MGVNEAFYLQAFSYRPQEDSEQKTYSDVIFPLS